MNAEHAIRPQPGPQESFLSTPADICFYGGEAGGGKSYGLILDHVRWKDLPGYSGIIFRRTSPELTGGGSLWEKCSEVYPRVGARGRAGGDLDWRWPSGALVQLRHLQHEKTKLDHQGKEYAVIGFDEVTHFSWSQFWYLVSRNRSTCGVAPYIRGTCNPDPDSWVRRMVDWWIGDDGFAIPERSGVVRWFLRDGDDQLVWGDSAEELVERYPHLTTEIDDEPMSFTFILARLDDNPALTKADPKYRARLMKLPLVERERLLGGGRGGNWDVRPAAGLLFKRAWFEVIDAVNERDVVRRSRGWDLAGTAEPTAKNPDPDYTGSMRWALMRDGTFVIEDAFEKRLSPLEVERALVNTASQDGPRVGVGLWQDPGQAGKAQAERLVRLLRGYRAKAIPAAKDKVTYAEPWSAQAEQGNIKVLRGDWNEKFFRRAEQFPEGLHDDVIDAGSRGFIDLTNTSAGWMADMKQAAAKLKGAAA